LDNEAEPQESSIGDSIISTIEHTDFTGIEIGSKLYWILKALSNDPSSSFALFNTWYFFIYFLNYYLLGLCLFFFFLKLQCFLHMCKVSSLLVLQQVLILLEYKSILND
jgi:hypothetical protein